MQATIGYVKKINVKSGTNRNGRPYSLYSCRLSDKQGNELPFWYSLGFKAPPFKEGDYVKFNATQKSEIAADVDIASVKVSTNAPPPPAAARQSGPASSGGAGNYNSDASRADRALHACRASAIELAGLLLAHDALPVTGAKGKAASAARFEEITAAVNKLTVELFRQEIEEGFEDQFPLLRDFAQEKVEKPTEAIPDVADEGDGFDDSDDAADEFEDDIPF